VDGEATEGAGDVADGVTAALANPGGVGPGAAEDPAVAPDPTVAGEAEEDPAAAADPAMAPEDGDEGSGVDRAGGLTVRRGQEGAIEGTAKSGPKSGGAPPTDGGVASKSVFLKGKMVSSKKTWREVSTRREDGS
jgi:hypothetical protein